MKIRNLDLDVLRSFAAIADTGSFTAAASAVARSQSAISVHIKRLEDAVGCKILERTSRSLGLTPAGELLLGYARRMLELNDESMRLLTEPPVAGEIRLGVTEYFLPGELPKLLRRFSSAYPDVHLEVRMGLSSDLREALANGELDTAIVRMLPQEKRKVIWSEPLYWVAATDFEFKKGMTVPLVALPPNCYLRDFATSALDKARQPWRIAFTTSSMLGLQTAVSAGLGVAILPISSISEDMKLLQDAKYFPKQGDVKFSIASAPDAPGDIVDALLKSTHQTLSAMLRQ
jgi:DNA-binding transcriptional LysR family regulator